MSTPVRPSTPVAKTDSPALQSTPGGTWRHPKLDEINRRQNATRFTEKDLHRVLFNTTAVVVLFVAVRQLSPYVPSVARELLGQPVTYATYVVHIFLLFNVAMGLWPLFRTPDDLSDIPLTAAQRKLLGLPPASQPPTPGSTYSTPPRFARTPTPSSSPASKIGNFSQSPTSGSPGSGAMSNSPFSPGNSTPYAKKALGGSGFDGSRRHSYGSPSPLGPAGSRANVNVLETPSTPTPAAGNKATVGLNSRWLYEKGRRNSGNLSRQL